MATREWEHLQTFLEAAQTGSFTAAARELGVSQPTVSRRIEELEQQLGSALFLRHSRGLRLTDRGTMMLESVRGLDSQVQEVFRRVGRGTTQPEGVVRLSVNEPLAVYALPGALREIAENYPQLELEVIVENSTADLTRREADLAVRMFRPEQLDLLATEMGSIGLSFFASRQYLATRPCLPLAPLESSLEGHTLIGMDDDASFRRLISELGFSPSAFAFRTDNLLLSIEAVRAGVGIGVTHTKIGRDLGLVQVDLGVPLPRLPVWLVRHEALRNDLAVRTVARVVEQHLRAYVGEELADAAHA